VSPADVEAIAKKYFVENGRTVATLQFNAEPAAEKSE
jgi:hypothetical protein